MVEFVDWIKKDPVMSKETYFLSAEQLVAYMKAPFDKAGVPAKPDPIATPDSNGIFTRLTWKTDQASIKATDGNTADIVFDLKSIIAPGSVTAGIVPGSLKNLSHIDIKYSTEVPFRIRLLTSGGVSTTVLLAGTGGTDRLARIRVKDFFPGREATDDDVIEMPLVDAAYMDKVNGISFESAATLATSAKTFNTHIRQITLHGANTAGLCQ